MNEEDFKEILNQSTKCPKCEADIVLILPEVITCSKCNWFEVHFKFLTCSRKKKTNE